VVVAELEAFFSRPVAPTRRVAIGDLTLPDDAAAEAAAMLLGGIVAGFGRSLDSDDRRDLERLVRDVEVGRRVAQPRLRHRYQRDRVGLQRCAHRLLSQQGRLVLDLDAAKGTAEQHLLAAVYAAGDLSAAYRVSAVDALRRGLAWHGAMGGDLLAHLRGWGRSTGLGPAGREADPVRWALGVLGLVVLDGRPSEERVRRAFRDALRSAHPDHGAPTEGAAERIAELDAARRILLGS
jgi:hypothetical protein